MPSAPHAFILLITGASLLVHSARAQLPEPDANELPVKYAIYSSAWSESSNAGLRIVAQNQTQGPIELVSVIFRDEDMAAREETLRLNLAVPAHGWAERQLPYIDLIFGNDCISKTMEDGWKLVEISNYTLNPSVRGLIIEDTSSFRIYQCVRPVFTTWIENGETRSQAEWVLYHYERRPQNN